MTACADFNLEKFHGPDCISNNFEPAANRPMLRSDRNRLLLNIKVYRLATDEPCIDNDNDNNSNVRVYIEGSNYSQCVQ